MMFTEDMLFSPVLSFGHVYPCPDCSLSSHMKNVLSVSCTLKFYSMGSSYSDDSTLLWLNYVLLPYTVYSLLPGTVPGRLNQQAFLTFWLWRWAYEYYRMVMLVVLCCWYLWKQLNYSAAETVSVSWEWGMGSGCNSFQLLLLWTTVMTENLGFMQKAEKGKRS